MRLLVTGAGGQLGHDLTVVATAAGDDVVALARSDLDVGDRDAVLGAVTTIRPDVVVNAAAWTAVDACEGDPDRAYRDNALAVRWLREAAERIGAHLVNISTDYVFSGELDRPYREWDDPDPRSVYGASKLAGEREAGSDTTTIRTSWVCGEHGHNMVATVLRLLADDPDRTLRFVDDQRGCPTFTADLAPMVRQLALERRPGVYHVTNAGPVSWHEFVQEIVVAAGGSADQVEPINTADLHPPRPAARPPNSVLDNVALRMSGIEPLRHHHRPLVDLVERLR